MIASGIDLGGTKIEAQVFGADWQLVARRRIATPKDYPALIDAVVEQIRWSLAEAGSDIPVGISAAGLVNPATGLALTSNLPAMGRPFPADLEAAAGRKITYVNDCRSFALSEATFGAGRGKNPVMGLVFGTGVAGGVVVDGRLMPGFATVGGEVGHFSVAAGPMIAHGLPVIRCGCGRMGCTETLLSGPGLARIARHVTGRELTAVEVAAGRMQDAGLAKAWGIWCELAVEMLVTLCLTYDPACIVLGGGLSKAAGLVEDLTRGLAPAMLTGFPIPEIRLAEGGDASGARGAAFAAWQEVNHG